MYNSERAKLANTISVIRTQTQSGGLVLYSVLVHLMTIRVTDDRYPNESRGKYRLLQSSLPAAEPRGQDSCSPVASFTFLYNWPAKAKLRPSSAPTEVVGRLCEKNVILFGVDTWRPAFAVFFFFSASRLFHTRPQKFKLSRAVTAGHSVSVPKCQSPYSRSPIGRFGNFAPAYNDVYIRSGAGGAGSEKRKTRARI